MEIYGSLFLVSLLLVLILLLFLMLLHLVTNQLWSSRAMTKRLFLFYRHTISLHYSEMTNYHYYAQLYLICSLHFGCYIVHNLLTIITSNVLQVPITFYNIIGIFVLNSFLLNKVIKLRDLEIISGRATILHQEITDLASQTCDSIVTGKNCKMDSSNWANQQRPRGRPRTKRLNNIHSFNWSCFGIQSKKSIDNCF